MKNLFRKIFLIGLAISAFNPILALSGEAGTALKADTIRAEPFADAKTVGNFNKGDSVDILSKKGAWLQVKTKKNTGWVRILSVKRGSVSGGNSAKGVLDVASGRAGTGQVVSTTGIRGLSAEELKAAKFNEEEMKKMESHTLSASDGQSFASAGGLSAIKMAYLKGTK
ncbi:MAG: SH3 domain-containing protein [Methylotenera sp.]